MRRGLERRPDGSEEGGGEERARRERGVRIERAGRVVAAPGAELGLVAPERAVGVAVLLSRHSDSDFFHLNSSLNRQIIKYVSNVTDMYHMFQNASSFNQPLNHWNVSNVRYIGGMFRGAESFNHAPHAPWYHEESESE